MEDNTTHPDFGDASIENGNVQFTMNEIPITLDSLSYYVKVTADGGEIYWSEEKYFATECGPESA